MGKIRVLVVDDSAFMRKVLVDLLSKDSAIEVVGTAKNGKDAIRKVEEHNPDVVTMDIEMPEMDGMEALMTLMKDRPLPVVMISSLTREGADATLQALEWGAIDFILKPSGSISLDMHKVQDQIIEKVKSAAKAKTNRAAIAFHTSRPNKPLPSSERPQTLQKNVTYPSKGYPLPTGSSGIPHLVVIGTSTGGPNALRCLLGGLPEDLPAAIFIVQHMPTGFTKSLSMRLDSLCAICVKEAEDGMIAKAGHAYIAPGNFHMEVKSRHGGQWEITLNQREPLSGHRPSVDELFQSVSRLNHPSKYAVILTGMGSDGTKGLKMLKSTGCKEAIAEDEGSCVVFGMPKSAILSGNIDRVLPLSEIGPYLVSKLKAVN